MNPQRITTGHVTRFLIQKVGILAEETIRENGVFRIAVSGGDVIEYFCNMILHPKMKSDLSKWKIFFAEEYHVPETDPISVYGQYKAKLIVPNSPIKLEQLHPVNTSFSLYESSRDYQNRLLAEFGCGYTDIPSFDCLILEAGVHGQLCGMFPRHRAVGETDYLVAYVHDAPFPPIQRITMLFTLLHQAKVAFILITGPNKKVVAQRMITPDKSYACNMMQAKKELYTVFDYESLSITERLSSSSSSSDDETSQPTAAKKEKKSDNSESASTSTAAKGTDEKKRDNPESGSTSTAAQRK